MCGIIGYVGISNASEQILEGLRRIEYRGYDSSGLALMTAPGNIYLCKTKGGIDSLAPKINPDIRAKMGIGHTRWATHGVPSARNAHPHSSHAFTIVHNGIVENYEQIKQLLEEEGFHDFKSETDTEILVWLLERNFLKSANIRSALVDTLKDITGTFGIAFMHKSTPNVLYVARRSSPVVIAEVDGGHFIASDISALPKDTKRVTYLDDDQFAVVTANSLSIYDLNHDIVDHKTEGLKVSSEEVGKNGSEHFMLKEILEQPQTVAETLRGRIDLANDSSVLGGLNLSADEASRLRELVAVGCGTAHYSSVLASYLLEDIVNLPLRAEVASEFLYRKQSFSKDELMGIAVSQSGETADTIAAINKLGLMGVSTYGIVNAVGSNIARITDGGTYLRCGPEIAVASTKAFTSQVVAQILLGMRLGMLRGEKPARNRAVIKQLQELPSEIEKTIEMTHQIVADKAKQISKFDNVMYLGRGSLYPVALEGALKFKEVSYIPAEAHPAGEMKHGPLALIDKKMLVVYLLREGDLFEKSLSNLIEIDARGGQTLVLTDSARLASKRDGVILLPKSGSVNSPLLFNLPLQLLAYYVAKEKKLSIDKPRNLAKSVTVE